MAEEYDEFDYIPDDLDDEYDHQEKKIEESNRENKNKNTKRTEAITNLKNTNTDEEDYKFDTINTKKTERKNNLNKHDEDVEEIKLDDINGESDYKSSQKIPSGRVENSLYEKNAQRNNLASKVKNISSIPVNENLNSSTQTNHNYLNISTTDINNINRHYNNSAVNKDVYQANDISRLETYNNISSSNVKYSNQLSDKINLSHISQTRTPKNVNSSKHYSYMNIENNQDVSKKFDTNFVNESNISHNNRNYYHSQIRVDKNKSYIDSMNREVSALNNDFRRGQNNISEINSHNYNINNNSYVSYKMPSVVDMNSRIMRIGNNNIVSKLQYAETKYDELKNFYSRIQQNFSDRKINELENNSNFEKHKVLEFISKHNYELLKYIDNLNKVINIVIDASKNSLKNAAVNRNKKYPPPYNNPNINEVNNNKLLEVFRKEHLKLDHRFNQISDPSYEEKLEESLAELKDQINFYDTENRKLKISQKQSEAMFERQYKNNNLSLQTKNLEINKVNIEYENTRRLNENVLEKIQKNKIVIADNEQKMNELNDWLSKLETIAKEMYGITEFLDKENIKKFEKAEKQKSDFKLVMKKKTEVLEKVLITNKKKYEGEIIKNEKSIVNLEKQKMDLMRQIKEKNELSKAVQMKVRQLYSQYDNSLEMFNLNSSHNGEEFENTKNQSNENSDYLQNPQINVQNLPRTDQNLENNDAQINLGLNNNTNSLLYRSQNNPNPITNNPNLISQNNYNFVNLRENVNEEDKVKLMNGRFTIENENINNLNSSKKDELENLERASQVDDKAALDTQNKKSNKPNFKFNVNLNQINNNPNNNIIPVTNSEMRSSVIGEERLDNTNNINPNNEIRENLTKPFRINSTSSKNNNNNKNENYFPIPNNSVNDINNGSDIKNINSSNQAQNNNSRINTANNKSNEDNADKNIFNINSRRRNINMNNKYNNNQNETNYSKKDLNSNQESKKNLVEIETKENFPNNNSNGKIPISLAYNINNNPDQNNQDIEEIKHNNQTDNRDKISNFNKSNQISSTNIYDRESKREKMIGKEKRNILQNLFSDDNDDVINLGEEEKLNLEDNNIENQVDEKRKKAFENLFKEDDQIEIPKNRFKLQMNKGNDNNSQIRSVNNENDNLNTKNNIAKKNEKPKNFLDELEDIVL